MKACGIVAEYNPFHHGHAYQIEQARQKLGDDVVIIAAMSGNFLQRGEPAIVDKWTRTQMALNGGVDLVVELPVHWSTQPADFFAQGALEILQQLGINYLSFGAEAGSAEDFMTAARILVEKESVIASEIKASKVTGIPYAEQMENILLTLAPEFPLRLHSPNNQLGLSYVTEIIKNNWENQVKILPIIRKGAGYLDETLSADSQIASATAIRKAVFANEDVENYIPEASYPYFKESLNQTVSWEDYFPLLKYQLLVQSPKQLREIYQMTEGLENRLKKHIQEAETFNDFITKIKTKRYTQTRLQRLLIYVLLQMRAEDVHQKLSLQTGIRVLGFNERGQRYLSQRKHFIDSPLITNVNQKTKSAVELDIRAGNIYQLGNKMIQKQDFTRKPIKYD